MHATPGNFTMSDHEEENAILTDKGKENDKGKDADRSSDRLLTARMDLMLQSMQQMWEEMKAGQEEMSLKLANAKHDPFSFRRKGNENQLRFCEDVEEQLQSASSSISRAEKRAGKEALSRAKNAVEQGMELLSCRKKLIKLADRSEAGWALVEEYVEDDLAEDERRIQKAERAAERKIAKRLHKAKEPTALVPFAGSAPGACHQCGKFGHWRRECPKRVAAGATYPLLHVVSKNAEYTEDTCSGVKGVCKGNEGVDLQKGDILLPLSRVDCIVALLFGGRSYVPTTIPYSLGFETCKAKGTSVVPAWESGPFWPLICPNGLDFAKFVDAFVSLPLSDNLFALVNLGKCCSMGKS